jgi:16S rRNA (guanine527-N7)-methyltransferase
MTKNISNPDISIEKISEALIPFPIHLSVDQLSKVRQYVRLLLKWNRVMSLTTITDPIEIVSRHFGESMFGATIIPVENCRLADVGTGAGFPGLALKIFRPKIQVKLIESNKKKIAFLSEVIRDLELTEVEILATRFEDMRPEELSADVVTARAVGGFSELLDWSGRALSSRGHVLLWVGGEDITMITNSKGWTWSPPVRIPESQRRFILVGQWISDVNNIER